MEVAIGSRLKKMRSWVCSHSRGSDLLPDYDGLLKDLANPELPLEQVMGVRV